MHSGNTTSVFHLLTPFICDISIERDAQLLANRIALLKQEEMKTWKKIEETKKRTNDITNLKKRNEEKVQKVRIAGTTKSIWIGSNSYFAIWFYPIYFENFHLLTLSLFISESIRATDVMVMITFVEMT